jgi:hypothetical protein
VTSRLAAWQQRFQPPMDWLRARIVAYFGVGWPMPHGGAVHDMEPCRHHAPRPGHADGARLRCPPAVAGIAARLRTCGKTASCAGQRLTHSSEVQPGRRCRTRVEGVSAAESLGTLFRKIGIKSRGELTRLVVQRSADSQQGGADAGLAAGARERRLPHRVARPRSGRRSAACAAACRSAGRGSLAGTARQAASDGPGTVALPRQTQARCPRQAPARRLARFGRRPRGLSRSPPRRQRTTACRTPCRCVRAAAKAVTCADAAPALGALRQE